MINRITVVALEVQGNDYVYNGAGTNAQPRPATW